ncbi:MAG TPA: hypothetical protein VFQ63_01930 [Patescibacteria group bacterium]|nr:hypothetical protein [Patescibacteria group bacterium]
MANGLGGTGGGFGETIFDATKKAVGQQVKQTGQAIVQQVTGKPVGGTFTMPQGGGQPQGLPSLDNFGDINALFEKNAPTQKPTSPFGSAPAAQQPPQQTAQMTSQQQAEDAQKIAQLTSELHQLYAKDVMESGERALEKERKYLEEQRQADAQNDAEKKAQTQQSGDLFVAPGAMGPGQMTGAPQVTSATRSGEAKHSE